MFNLTDSIYCSGPIRPVVKIRENMSIWTGGAWEHYRAEFIEPMPRSTPLVVEMVTASGATLLAAGATIAKRVVAILQLNGLELLHLRWEPLDNVEGVLWEQSGTGRFQSRGAVARVDRNTVTRDPYLSTTTFFIIGRDRDMNLEVRNPMRYATPTARFQFWGYRYMLKAIVDEAVANLPETGPLTKARARAALRAGDLDVVKRLIGATTWLPAEGRA